MKPKRCGNCGSNNVKKSSLTGLVVPWKDYPAAYLIDHSDNFLRCQKCGESMLSANDMKAFDALIKESINQQVNLFIDKVLEREKCNQGELAQHLGVTQEYLSEIKSGRKTPSFQTFNFLKTLAIDEASFGISDPKFDISKQVAV